MANKSCCLNARKFTWHLTLDTDCKYFVRKYHYLNVIEFRALKRNDFNDCMNVIDISRKNSAPYDLL